MRLKLGDDAEKWLKRILIGGVVFFAASAFAGWNRYAKSGDSSDLCIGFILGLLMLVCTFLFVLIMTEREINEFGVREYGFFGKIKLKELSWNDMTFVGSVIIMTGRTKDTPVRMIVCSASRPRKRYKNSPHYQQPKGKHINFPDRPDVRAQICKYAGDRFEEL